MSLSLYALAASVLLSTALGFGLYKSVQHSERISAELTIAQQEKTDAEVKEALAAEATRNHDRELARLRKQAAGAAKSIVATADDGCLDRGLPDSVLRALRVQPEGGAAKSPASGGPKARP